MGVAPGRRRIVVVGSCNADCTVYLDRMPGPGETVFGRAFQISGGGKGANQAVAAGRLGGTVSLLGAVGEDWLASLLLQSLSGAGVETGRVRRLSGHQTGTACVLVEPGGENRIAVVPGANEALRVEDLAVLDPLWPAAAVLLLQLEIPLAVVEEAAVRAARHGVTVCLDPAPAPAEPLPPRLLHAVDVLLPNEHEAAALSGRPAGGPDEAAEAARSLLDTGVRAVALKRGAEGVLLAWREAGGLSLRAIPGLPVKAVDATGAGDAFAGALAVRLAEGHPLPEAAVWANRAAALSTTRPGAQAAMPARAEVESFTQ